MMNLSYKKEFKQYKKMIKVHKHSILTMINKIKKLYKNNNKNNSILILYNLEIKIKIYSLKQLRKNQLNKYIQIFYKN